MRIWHAPDLWYGYLHSANVRRRQSTGSGHARVVQYTVFLLVNPMAGSRSQYTAMHTYIHV